MRITSHFICLKMEIIFNKNKIQFFSIFYSGFRQQNDTLLMIYHHDQTVAIVELGEDKLLVGCELIEI